MVHEQAAAFVLDALDSEEAREFEQHLRVCPDCEEELDRLRVAAAALAFAGELPPPRATLRRRVLSTDAIVLRFPRHARAPVFSAVALAACVALVLSLTPTAPRRHRLVLQLPAAPAGKVYEIWFVRRGRAVPAGLARGGRTEVEDVPPGAAVAVTLERRGGSQRPTGPLLLRTETA